MITLRVGIIGANAERGLARESQVPAVQHLDGLELAAVANKGQKAAEAAAAAFGAPKAYGARSTSSVTPTSTSSASRPRCPLTTR